MKLEFVTHDGYGERFALYSYERTDHGDNGIRLKLEAVTGFAVDDDGRWTFTFHGGNEIDVPYGEIYSGTVEDDERAYGAGTVVCPEDGCAELFETNDECVTHLRFTHDFTRSDAQRRVVQAGNSRGS